MNTTEPSSAKLIATQALPSARRRSWNVPPVGRASTAAMTGEAQDEREEATAGFRERPPGRSRRPGRREQVRHAAARSASSVIAMAKTASEKKTTRSRRERRTAACSSLVGASGGIGGVDRSALCRIDLAQTVDRSSEREPA